MARSRKKTPAGGNTVAKSDQPWKRQSSRILRRRVREAICDGRFDALPDERLVRDSCTWPKDGKQWYGFSDPKLLRK